MVQQDEKQGIFAQCVSVITSRFIVRNNVRNNAQYRQLIVSDGRAETTVRPAE